MQSFKRCFIFLYFLFINCSLFADLASETVYLTWKKQPESTMTIQWITPLNQEVSQIFYKSTKEQNWKLISGNKKILPHTTDCLLHSVELLNLLPSTQYEFRIAKSDHLDTFLFETMPKELNESIRFVVGGDMFHDDQTTQDMRKTCVQAAKTNPHFALIGGDIAYAYHGPRSPEKTERWIEWIRAWNSCMRAEKNRLIPVISAIGNHDIYGHFDQTPKEAEVFSVLFPMPGEQIYNVLDFGSYLSVLILDSGHANKITGAQAQWISDTLKERQDRVHRFAIYHVPAYPSVRPFSNSRSSEIRRNWVKLFEQGGINMVFEHHDHAYKRTHPLIQGKVNAKGIVYVGDGAWSVDKPRSSRYNQKLPYLAKFKASRHFILMTLNQNKRHLKCIDENGGLVDEYISEIVKMD